MVCQTCHGSIPMKHNSRTCPLSTPLPLEGIAGCMNIFKEPKIVKPKKVNKPLEGLAGCMNIFKEPKIVKLKKMNKSLEGLAGCLNIFKEPKIVKPKKHLKTCGGCGEKGHNKRTCSMICRPYVVQDHNTPTKAEIRVATVLTEILNTQY